MSPVRAVPACEPHRVEAHSSYQHAAALAVFRETNRTVQPWHWITTRCAEPFCMVVEHMHWEAPRRLKYPHGLCVYCGNRCGTRDHLLPVNMTGKAARRYILTVPACGECNSFIGDRGGSNVDDRRARAHDGIRRKHKRKLATKVWTEAELDELGPTLRSHVEGAVAAKREVLCRLEWPDDPAYDLRALEQSGIHDPYATGLLGRVAS